MHFPTKLNSFCNYKYLKNHEVNISSLYLVDELNNNKYKPKCMNIFIIGQGTVVQIVRLLLHYNI